MLWWPCCYPAYGWWHRCGSFCAPRFRSLAKWCQNNRLSRNTGIYLSVTAVRPVSICPIIDSNEPRHLRTSIRTPEAVVARVTRCAGWNDLWTPMPLTWKPVIIYVQILEPVVCQIPRPLSQQDDQTRGLCVRVSMSALIGAVKPACLHLLALQYTMLTNNISWNRRTWYKLTVGSGRRSYRNGHPAEGTNMRSGAEPLVCKRTLMNSLRHPAVIKSENQKIISPNIAACGLTFLYKSNIKPGSHNGTNGHNLFRNICWVVVVVYLKSAKNTHKSASCMHLLQACADFYIAWNFEIFADISHWGAWSSTKAVV